MTPAARERLKVRVPLFAASGVAWLLLAVQPHEVMVCAMPSMQAARMNPASLAAGSALMFAAMMLPLLGPPLRHLRDRGLARRRARATALFLGGYGLPWIAAGVALIVLADRIVAADSPAVLALAIAAIAGWQFSPAKQRCLNRCHAHSALAAFGPSADRDALRFGARHAAWCIASCSGLMLLPMLFPSVHLAGMAAITLWLASERLDKPMPARWSLRGPGKMMRIAIAQLRLAASADRRRPAG